MSLYVLNFYPVTTSVAIMWYDPFCDGKLGNFWRRQGWFNINPNSLKKVLPNAGFPDTGDDLSDINRYFCFFARATNGATWSGPYSRKVTNSAFVRHDCVGYTGGFFVGFRLFDVDGHDDYILQLG